MMGNDTTTAALWGRKKTNNFICRMCWLSESIEMNEPPYITQWAARARAANKKTKENRDISASKTVQGKLALRGYVCE